MSIKIKNLKIEKLFGYKDLEWKLSDVSVLVGKNGSGKSTILNIIKDLLLTETDKNIHQCGNCELSTSNNLTIKHKHIPLSSLDLNSFISSLEEFMKKDKRKKSDDKINIETNLFKIKKMLSSAALQESPQGIRTGMFEITDKNKIHDKKLEKSVENGEFKIPFEYISTINMNANSLNEFKSSDGNKTTILDMEIKKEISRMNEFLSTDKDLHQNIKKRFVSAINYLLSECNKIMNFDSDMQFICKHDGKKLDIKDLSSGERQLVYTLLKASIAAFNDAILLMDEPEISLHLSWQENLISTIKEINPNGQIIIVTHSPAVVMNGWMDSFVDIKDL